MNDDTLEFLNQQNDQEEEEEVPEPEEVPMCQVNRRWGMVPSQDCGEPATQRYKMQYGDWYYACDLHMRIVRHKMRDRGTIVTTRLKK